MFKPMTAKFPSTCLVCGEKIAAEAPIMYDRAAPRGQRTVHPACLDKVPARPASAGPVESEKDGNWLVRHYDSIEAYATQPVPNDKNARILENTTTGKGNNPYWFGVENARAVERARQTGWEEGVTKMLALEVGETPTPVNVRRRSTWSDQGDAIDIHRVYSGNLERAWRRTLPRAVSGVRPITIISLISTSSRQSADQLFWRGAAALRIADALTEAGHSVEILGAMICTSVDAKNRIKNRINLQDTFVVKESSAPLELNSLAVTMSLAGFFRVYGFRSIASIPENMDDCFGFHREDEIQKRMDKLTAKLREDGRTVIALPVHCYDQRTAQDAISAAIQQVQPMQEAA